MALGSLDDTDACLLVRLLDDMSVIIQELVLDLLIVICHEFQKPMNRKGRIFGSRNRLDLPALKRIEATGRSLSHRNKHHLLLGQQSGIHEPTFNE